MSQNRTDINISGNQTRQQGPGDCVMTEMKLTPVATVGNQVLAAGQVINGAILRTGPVGAYGDTLPDAAVLDLAVPDFNAGDSFELLFINTVAFANTLVAGLGVVLGINPTVAASSTRRFLFTCLAAGVNTIAPVTTTNASPLLTGLSATQMMNIQVGMGVTGAGIPANTFVIGINTTPLIPVVTLSANCTVTASVVAATFFPRYQVDGIASSTL
jgi:hypothetical protein